jgi:hypothetical protein
MESRLYNTGNKPEETQQPVLLVINDRLVSFIKQAAATADQLQTLADRIFGAHPRGVEARKESPSPQGHLASIREMLDELSDQLARVGQEAERFNELG